MLFPAPSGEAGGLPPAHCPRARPRRSGRRAAYPRGARAVPGGQGLPLGALQETRARQCHRVCMQPGVSSCCPGRVCSSVGGSSLTIPLSLPPVLRIPCRRGSRRRGTRGLSLSSGRASRGRRSRLWRRTQCCGRRWRQSGRRCLSRSSSDELAWLILPGAWQQGQRRPTGRASEGALSAAC